MFCGLSANSEEYKRRFWTKKCVVHALDLHSGFLLLLVPDVLQGWSPMCSNWTKRPRKKLLKKSLDFTTCVSILGHRDADTRKESCLCVAGLSQAASGPNDLILLPCLWNQFKWKTAPAPIQKLLVALVKPFPPPFFLFPQPPPPLHLQTRSVKLPIMRQLVRALHTKSERGSRRWKGSIKVRETESTKKWKRLMAGREGAPSRTWGVERCYLRRDGERGNVMFMWLGNENVSASWKVDRQEAYFIRLQHIGSDWHVVPFARNTVAYANEKTTRHMLHPPCLCHRHMRPATWGLGLLIK